MSDLRGFFHGAGFPRLREPVVPRRRQNRVAHRDPMNQPKRPILSPAMQAVHCAAILASAPFILFPSVRSLSYAKLAIGFVVLAMFAINVRRGMRNGELQRTLPEIYGQARAGRRVAGPMLQTAAVVAARLAMWLTY